MTSKLDQDFPQLRKGPAAGEKKPLREKVITYYDLLFQGEDPSGKRTQFWDEFFLLKVNVEYISQTISALEVKDLIALKKSTNLLFIQCVRILQVDDNLIRDINALQTLCALLKAVFQKGLADISFDLIDILVGFDSAECQMRNLVESLNKFLVDEYPVSIKNLALKLLLLVLTAVDNVSQNVILEYFMMNSIFESITKVISQPESRHHHGYDASVALLFLVNYRKYEAANPYVIKLSVLDNEIALNGLGCVISLVLTEYNRQYSTPTDQPVGLFGHLTSMVSNMLMPSEAPQTKIRISEAVLLLLYEAVHLNRNFITVLTHTHSPSQASTPISPSPAVERPLPLPSTPTTPDGSAISFPREPTNLLGTFLTFSSIIIQNTKDEKSVSHSKLCLIILTCIVEDQYANSFLHDHNMTFQVYIHRASLRHRKLVKEKNALRNMPLACSLLDLMVEFMLSHLSRNFKVELYRRCLGVIHRMLCYQKRCKIRLTYSWKDLWNALVNILKYFVANEQHLVPEYNIFSVAQEIVKIFNLFITYGDTFLPNPAAYDELYYEIIRMRKVFEDLYQMANRLSGGGGSGNVRTSSASLASSLTNICSISTHFVPKIDSWSLQHQVASITPEQVLDVVRSNYDTLTLKLYDNLDHYERYSEKPKETSFFTMLVRLVIQDTRSTISLSSLQQQVVLGELAAL